MEGAVPLPDSDDKGLRGIEDGMSMVLDTKNSILESWQRPRFLILFTMTLYHKMRQLFHYKMQQSLFLLRNASLHCTGIKSAHGVCLQRL